jgi:hypothetical protein
MRGLGVTLAATYLTGTLTGLIAARAQVLQARSDPAGIAAVRGAACGGLMLMSSASATPLLCVGPLPRSSRRPNGDATAAPTLPDENGN